MTVMTALVQQNKSLVLISVEQRDEFGSIHIIIMIIVICLLKEKKSKTLKPIIKMLTFHFKFFLEAY